MSASRPSARPDGRPRRAALLVRLLSLALAAAICSGAVVLRAQPPAATSMANLPPELASKLQQHGDLTLNDVTFQQALFAINEAWEVNLFAATDVPGLVSGVFHDAPLHEILDAILLAHECGYRAVGQSLVVMKLEDMGDFHPLFTPTTIVLRAAKPSEVLPGLELLKSPRGKIQSTEESGLILLIDYPDRVQMMREFAERADEAAGGGATTEIGGQGVEVGHFLPQFIKVESLREPVESVVGTEGKASVIVEENRLVVLGTREELAVIEKIVAQLDVPRPQVRITALIYDVSLEDMERLGINWNHAVKGRVNGDGVAESVFSIDSLMQVPAAVGDPSGTMAFMNLSRHFDLTAVYDAMSQLQNSQLLADPSVTVVDREEAMIEIVTEIPFQALQQSEQGGNIGTTEFRKAGVMLTVMPQIAQDGTVLLNVKPTFSRLVGFTTGQTPQPIIDTREAKTMVRVLDGQTLVIGGLRQRQDVGDFSGVPVLKNLWGVGHLFRRRETTTRETELVVFITPQLITPCYAGRPREGVALGHSHAHLEAVPPGGYTPFPVPRPPYHHAYQCPPPGTVCEPIVPESGAPLPNPAAEPVYPGMPGPHSLPNPKETVPDESAAEQGLLPPGAAANTQTRSSNASPAVYRLPAADPPTVPPGPKMPYATPPGSAPPHPIVGRAGVYPLGPLDPMQSPVRVDGGVAPQRAVASDELFLPPHSAANDGGYRLAEPAMNTPRTGEVIRR